MDILVLVDMQNDFLLPEGKLWIGHDTTEFVSKVEKTAMRWEGPVLGLLDTHESYSCEFKQWPEHCIEGTWGQKSVNDFYDKVPLEKCLKKVGFVAYNLLWELIGDIDNKTIHFAGVLASICVQENVAALYNFWKHEFNRIPNIVINPELIDDITPEAKAGAIKRMAEIYNVKIL